MTYSVAMLDSPCDRCGKVSPECYSFKLSENITFRGKVIPFPWLCPKCMMKEKEKWWKARRC